MIPPLEDMSSQLIPVMDCALFVEDGGYCMYYILGLCNTVEALVSIIMITRVSFVLCEQIWLSIHVGYNIPAAPYNKK